MLPYYDNGGITIYCADWRELDIDLSADLLLTDPPYGIDADKNKRANKQHGSAVAPSKDYGVGDWDDKPPTQDELKRLCAMADIQIFWGGNYFELPTSACWLVWDKDNGNNGYADCELAWTNLPGAIRRIKHRWMGMLQENMKNKEHRYHPTQKPLPVIDWALRVALQKAPHIKTVIDPYMGSGTTLRAARDMGLRAIGVEMNEQYCRDAVERLSQSCMVFV